MSVFPPLNGTELIVGNKSRLILDGMMGETEVQSVVYSRTMPPREAFVINEEMATYTRRACDSDTGNLYA